ncbi:hypothetical protein PF010_g1065 [Phytophthora fragariae]|uniref:PH domain-containing protein n=1 Tax=Phytophthora fragariae TaxID=53985 RepID=A0A6G0PU33_9STRA|nr:hypothetical protein PF010_g1065 [Phytophthora fragariae]KAE9254545.1 hypothetical protein PF004_g987 [Phytophthora fragariae]
MSPDYCGWGAKQGSKVRSWKNRYFVLRGRELVYYSGAKSDGSGAGVGEKGRLTVVNVDYSPDRKNGLLIRGEGKDLKMTTASAQESRVLFRKIKEAIGEQETSFRASNQQKTQSPKPKKVVEREGWLLQEETQLQTWKHRYVTLSGRTMEFRADQNSPPMESHTLVQVQADQTSPLSLGVVVRGGRRFHVAAETREEIEGWDRAIAAAIGQPLALRQVIEVQEEADNQEATVADTELVARKYSTKVCEGWLEKLGQRSKAWKKRYMTLANGMLEYRKGPMEQLSAELYVTDVRYSSEYSDALEIEFGSDKSLSDSDVICVRAESMRELDKWMFALCDLVGKPRLEPAEASFDPSSPSSSDPAEDQQSKTQLSPFPRNVSHSQGSDKSGTASSNTQPSTPANGDRSSGKQVTVATTTHRIKRGWLYEQSGQNSAWKLRYFVLDGNTLHHFEHVNGTSETLGNVTNVTRNNESTGCLGVQCENGSTLKVYGQTKADTESWFGALCKASWNSVENPAGIVSFSNQEEENLHSDNGFRGWLLKKGQNFKTWKRRYFVLESSRLAYSAKAGSEVLGSGVVFQVDVGDLRPFCLSIRFQNGRLLHVVAPTQEAFSRWFDVLRNASDLAESFISQSKGEIVFDEEFDNDGGENADEADVDFTEEDLAEYEITLRDGEGVSLWIAAMQNKPEYDALSSSASEQGDDVANSSNAASDIVPRSSDETLNESKGCVGWLKKEGGTVKSWKRRYFTLYGSKLSYYKSEKGSLLRSVNAVGIAANPSMSFGLTVSTAGGRKLIIQADSKEDFEMWLGAIREAVAGGNARRSSVMEPPSMVSVMENRSSNDIKASTSYSGWLQKEGQRFKTWKRRYFTVKNSALIYYSEIGGVARGHGMVKGAFPDDSKPHTLVIEFRSGKTMRVTAAIEADMNLWYQVLSRGRSTSSRTTAVSDVSDDVVDSEEEESDDGDRAARISRFDSKDYLNDTITNDTIMRLQDEEGKPEFCSGGVTGTMNAAHSFKGELRFNDEDEEKDDMGLSTTGADYYRKLLAEDERFQQQRSDEKLEPPIAGCAPCCTVM